jgi:hypothetical protein
MVDAAEISKEAKFSAQPERLWPPQNHDLFRFRLYHGKNGTKFAPPRIQCSSRATTYVIPLLNLNKAQERN